MSISYKKESRPNYKAQWTPLRTLLEGISITSLALLILIPAWYYFDLPAEIPTHFNSRGQVDAYGHKATLWILPLIGVFMYGLLTILVRNPAHYNYPVKITEENAAAQYRLAVFLMDSMKALIMAMFAYLVFAMVDGARTGASNIGLPVWIFLGAIGALCVWYFFRAFNLR